MYEIIQKWISFFTPALKDCQDTVFTFFTVSRWEGRRSGGGKKVCSGCISETVRCRKLILGWDIS